MMWLLLQIRQLRTHLLRILIKLRLCIRLYRKMTIIFSPLYQVKFKNSEEEKVCNWKDILLIDVFTGRTYR